MTFVLGAASRFSRRLMVKFETPIARTLPESTSFCMAAQVTAGSTSARANRPSSSRGNHFPVFLKALVEVSKNSEPDLRKGLHRPVHKEQVEVVSPQVLQGLVDSGFNIFGS